MGFVVNIRNNMRNIEDIAARKGVNPGGKMQTYVRDTLIDMFDDYVPYMTGELRHSAKREISFGHDKIIYNTPYAAKMYYNPTYNFKNEACRGAFWDKRAWADNGNTFVNKLQLMTDNGEFASQ